MPHNEPLNQALRDPFLRDGFLHLPGFFDVTAIEELAADFERYIADVVPTLPPADAFYETDGSRRELKQLQRIEEHDARLGSLRERSEIVALAELLLDGPVRALGVEWFNKPPGLNRPTPPHQDGYYFCLKPDAAITLWIALDDADEENGCLRYVAGSHLLPIREHGRSSVLGFSQTILDFGPDDLAREYIGRLKRGDALVHHSGTIHRAEENRSQRPRRSAAVVFQSVAAVRDEAAWQRYLTSSKAQQKELGAIA
ncbi:MAG: phytanoyl-CoA dioxygenase family protein [Pirellulales bacterium]|nr:phytanoyl-CoA dioxygenase family protein [Pirellulales bacterium]